MNIIKKAQGWADQYGSILSASPETRFPWLYKGAVGGLEHVISVDNGGSYMELWRDGSGSYYATTGAAVKQMPGLAKGVTLDAALDKFFSLTAKLSKAPKGDRGPYINPARVTPTGPFHTTGVQNKPVKKALDHSHPGRPYAHTEGTPEHKHGPGVKGYQSAGAKRLREATEHSAARAGNAPVKKGKTKRDRVGHTQPAKRGTNPFKKNIIANVDPQIGPEFSVGHLKPSDLSPESSMKKAIRTIIKQVDKAGGYSSFHPRAPGGEKAHKHQFTSPDNGSRYKYSHKHGPGTHPQAGKPKDELKKANDGVGYGSHGNQPGGKEHWHGATRKPYTHSHSPQEHSFKKPAKGALKKVRMGQPGGRVGADGTITPVQMPKPGTPGTGVPVGYGSTGQPHFNYPSTWRGTNKAQKAAAKKNIVGLSGRGGAGAKSGRIRNPKPHGRMVTAAEPKHYPFQSEPHGAEGLHSHEYGEGLRGTHTHPGAKMNLPHSDVGTSSDFHSRNMWLKPQKKAVKKCSPCELRKAVLSAGKAVRK